MKAAEKWEKNKTFHSFKLKWIYDSILYFSTGQNTYVG